ncbi:MAG: N-acetylmuramoyl-L-alanine amidase family protein [Chloroflexota bacterium]
MRRHIVREKTLAHIVTALGVLLLGIALASGPLGRSAQQASSDPIVAAAALQAKSPALEDTSSPGRQSGLEDVVRSRGGRSGEQSSPEADSMAQATATATATATSAPTATPKPEATAAPTLAPTSAPPAADGPKLRVGIQSGHWKSNELPAELASLRTSTGAAGSGWTEAAVNLDLAKRVVGLLEKENLIVDLIPATVPVQYEADAFVSIHGDANSSTVPSGYKLARATRSGIPAKDDALLRAISSEYGAATKLPYHAGTITVNMTAYYAFANRGIQHSVAPTTPSVILETGFLTNPGDRRLLTEQPDMVAASIARGILSFLGR